MPTTMKPLLIALLVLLLVLQYKLCFSSGGILDTYRLKKQIAIQQAKNDELNKQNAALLTNIKALKTDKNIIESHARNELGMIKQGETFYQVVK